MFPWLSHHRAAPAQGLVLAALSILGLLLFPVTVIAMLSGVVEVAYATRWLPRLRRRLALRWSAVDIPDPYLPPPPRPQSRRDGLYRHGMRLYKSERHPLRLRRAQHILRDPASWRDVTWLAADPLIGAPLAVLPAALTTGGLLVLFSPLWWRPAPLLIAAGGAATVAGLAAGPRLIWAHGCWTRVLLAPAGHLPALSGSQWLRQLRYRAQGLGAAILWSALAIAGLVLAILQIAALIALIPIGLVALYPETAKLVRGLTNFSRQLAAECGGFAIPAPYATEPSAPALDADGYYEYNRRLYPSAFMPRHLKKVRWINQDPATWRDLGWLLVNPAVTAALLLAPLGLAWLPIAELPGAAGIAVAALVVIAAVWVSPRALRLHARFARLLLGPAKGVQLVQRVQQLTETRADASAEQAAELRRIERDLHDGAQTRLVSIGMTLLSVEERLGGQQPEISEMVAEARRNSAAALSDLRVLIRGIHPPVLAERGLGDAVRALALDCPLPVQATVTLPGRPPPALEACVYFIVSESLANAAKHAAASHVRIDLTHDANVLRIRVTDNGRGGADPERGSGLRGIRRRLGTFDGVLHIASPVGGPTTLTMELPCVLSSPRTSTS